MATQTTTRPPSGTGHESAAIALLRTADTIRRRYDRLFDPYGVTLQQYNVLRILRGARPHGLHTMEIAERMIERTPGITRLLDRLEGKGLVGRERSTEDRRCVRCRVTHAGLELLASLDGPVARADKEAVEMLNAKEQQGLVHLLERLRAARD